MPSGSLPQRTPAIVGNWKLWGTRAQAADHCDRLLALLPDEGRRPAAVGICAPFTSLDLCVEKLSGSGVGVYAQTMHQEESGAFTGEVSAPMLTEIGIDGVVLGHSERRQFFCETDRALQEKVAAALAAGLRPILCVGETEDEREAGETERKLRHQVQEGLEKVESERLAEVTIAYEPIWAVGTGQVATPEIAQDAIAFVRALVADRAKEAAERIRVLYGGSVKPDNAAAILAQPDVDGALVGGASLDPESFARIIAAAAP
ncbi:MAG: triose-phosphate isomerase [Thermoleophilaceae bacterium]|nr:triose-phosphate isomerase [Thermoleophilaceae bacterium]